MPENSPGIDWPWLRRIRVECDTPNRDSSGATYSTMRSFESTGKPDGLRVTARIHKSIQGIPNATVITLHNLSRDTRSMFQRDRTKVRIRAGWETGPKSGISECFYGSLLSAVHNRSGADIVTTIQAVSMLDDLARRRLCFTWGLGHPVEDIALKLARELPAVRVDPARVKGITARVGLGGWSHAGSIRSALDALAKEFSFSWTIADGVFQAVGDDASLGNCASLRDPWLIDLNPILSGPLQIATGIKARCAFDPNIMPGYEVAVQSALSPKYNGGGYRVSSVTHGLDCYAANAFSSEMVAFMPPGERSL